MAINNQGIFIGKDTDGFLWYNGTETALTSLIPSAYSSEISYITPRLLSNSDTNGVIQILIDARFTDPSTTISSTNTYVLSGSYASLTRGSWALAQVQLPSGMSTANIHCINNSGILATANLPADGVSSSPVVGFCPPVQLTQNNYPTNILQFGSDSGSTGQQAISSGTGPSSVAYITGAPAMPQLQVQFANASMSGLNVTWSMNVVSERSERGTMDNYYIPASGGTTIAISQPWNINQSMIAPADFFGGKCTLYYSIADASGNALCSGTYPFLIRGTNPMDGDAIDYIQNNQGSFWYSWAIVQHESRQTPAGQSYDTVYNQFNSTGSTKYLPNFGAPHGWGIAQLDNPMDSPATTEEVYNWNDNVQTLFAELVQKQVMANNYLSALRNIYQSNGTWEEPPATVPIPGTGMSISPLDAATIVLYNGASWMVVVKNGAVVYNGAYTSSPPSGSVYVSCLEFRPNNPSGQKWVFHDNTYNGFGYAKTVLYDEYEGNLPYQE